MKTAKLGDMVRDRVSGFKGIVTCDSRFLNGCRRLGVQPAAGRNGELKDSVYFDDAQLEIIKKSVIKGYLASTATTTTTGGDRPQPRNPNR